MMSKIKIVIKVIPKFHAEMAGVKFWLSTQVSEKTIKFTELLFFFFH